MAHRSVAAETNGICFRLIRDGVPRELIVGKDMTLAMNVEATTKKPFSGLSPFQKRIFSEVQVETNGGLFLPFTFILPDDTTVIYYKNGITIYHPSSTKTITDNFIYNYTEDERYYWFSSDNGLHRIDKKTFTDTVYRFESGNPYALSESFLYYVCMDEKENLWIGTKGGGLNFFDREQNRFYHYTTSDGLPDNVVYFILPDKKENLWLSTNKGLSRFNPRDKTFTNFSRRDGLLNNEFNRLGGVLTDDGYIYFSGTSGIDYFKPEDLESATDSTAIYISGVQINGEESELTDLSSLKHFRNDLIIYFSSNEFIRPDLIYFRYRLKEDAPWTRVQGIHYASYSRVTPGSYSFEVQSGFDNLHWSESATVPFYIMTPWWKSWWFLVLSAIGISGGFYLFYRYRINQVKKFARLRSKISRDLHDEVGSTLSSIHVYSSVASKAMESNVDSTKNALAHIHQNARQVMENMSDIVWAIHTGQEGEITLEDKLKNYGYELLTPLNIHVTYAIDAEAEKKLIHIEARKNILLIAKEAMNNIARYSHATEASVRMVLHNKQLQLEIKDNGKGFNPSSGRHGNGLFNMQHRTDGMGGKFILDTEEDKGTSLSFSFPIARFSHT